MEKLGKQVEAARDVLFSVWSNQTGFGRSLPPPLCPLAGSSSFFPWKALGSRNKRALSHTLQVTAWTTMFVAKSFVCTCYFRNRTAGTRNKRGKNAVNWNVTFANHTTANWQSDGELFVSSDLNVLQTSPVLTVDTGMGFLSSGCIREYLSLCFYSWATQCDCLKNPVVSIPALYFSCKSPVAPVNLKTHCDCLKKE